MSPTTTVRTARANHAASRRPEPWWFVLVALAGWIVLLVLRCRSSGPTPNRFGVLPDASPAPGRARSG